LPIVSRVVGACACLLLFIAMLASGAVTAANAGPALVYDIKTGEVLMAEDAGLLWHPASLTKMMTAYVAFHDLKAGRAKLDQALTVSDKASKIPPSKLGMKAGSEISLDLALRAMLIHSANDMAMVIAENLGGSEEAFVRRMNAAASVLGMTGTRYVDPNGLNDEDQVTTARDQALLVMALVHEFPEYAHYFSEKTLKIGKRVLKNRNKLLVELPQADGMKTGFVCASGFNLAGSATFGNRHIGSIVFGTLSGRSRTELSKLLLEAGSRLGHSNVKVAQIANQRLGTAEPANLRQRVCGGGSRVAWGASDKLDGWAISLGSYDSAYTADAALQADGLLTGNVLKDLPSGIFRVPGKKEYMGLVWGLEQNTSNSACSYLKARGAACAVMSAEDVGELRTKLMARKKAAGSKKNERTGKNASGG